MDTIRITFWSLKGGVGKTTLAVNTALHFDIGIITNERYTMLDKIFDDHRFLKVAPHQNLPRIPREHSIIFDMGGYIDEKVRLACEQSDHIIIPTTSDTLDLQGLISTIRELETLSDKIIVVLNKVEKADELDSVTKLINQIQMLPTFPIKMSRAMKTIFDDRRSINQRQQSGGLHGYTLRTIANQFTALYDFLLNDRKGRNHV